MQYDDTIVGMARDMLIITLKIAAPILAAGVIIGLAVSILQAVTSIQDQTITFVPKIVVMVVVAALLLPWITTRLVDYASQLLWLVSSP